MDRQEQDRDDQLQLLSHEELQEVVRQRTAEVKNVMDAMADILIRLDEQGNIAMTNDAVSEILGYEKESLEGKPMDVLLTEPPEETHASARTNGEFQELLLTEQQFTDVEVYFETTEAEPVPMSLSASILEDQDGHFEGVVCVAKDISDRKEAEERAAFLHQLLRHDLGNSLQISQGYLEMLLETELTDTQHKYADESLTAIQEMIELIRDIRTLNQLEGSEDPEAVKLAGPLENALDRFESLQAQQGIDLETNIDEVTVVGGTLLTEVFANLVENVYVHSNADHVSITTTVEPDTVTVTVEDNGEGIPTEDRDKIFERGYSTGSRSGSGLGMYIVEQLLETYNGTIEVQDSDLGGARFDVILQRPGAT